MNNGSLFDTSDLKYTDGKVNVALTMAAFEKSLADYIVRQELEGEAIATAVNAVFDQYKGARMNTPFVVNQALIKLEVTPANSQLLTERVTAYLQENTDRQKKVDRKTKAVIHEAEEDRTRLFGVSKGPGGGLVRWADIPETK